MKKEFNSELTPETLRYLRLLSRNFPNIASASTEIINLEAIRNLPKGTEHFLADLHGEYEAFQHVLRNASGAIKRKVKEIFIETLPMRDQKELCTLIYYPELKLEIVKRDLSDEEELNDWYFVTLNRLVMVCRNVSSKYTRSKVRRALPKDFSYIIQELLHESTIDTKQAYVEFIVRTIISTKRSDAFIISICNLIQQLAIDSLHILGDVFDRGPQPDKIMDLLCDYHNFDCQWGNHDILWMGAASGNDACIANVIRISMRYANQSVLEDGYGINLLPLATFAMDIYGDDPCERFQPKLNHESRKEYGERNLMMLAQMHKAISIIQFKLEAQIIMRHSRFEMEDRLLLSRLDLKRGKLVMDSGAEYDLTDSNFPTIDPADPYRLTDEEADVVAKLHKSFMASEKLHRHIHCLLSKGSMYTVINSNLLFHASVPLNDDGTLRDVEVAGVRYHGKALLDRVDTIIREAYFGTDDNEHNKYALDFIWYLWCGKDSPAFDKDKMTTFERYFVCDKELHREKKGAYYTLRDDEGVIDNILDEFGVTGEHRHIINGHVPVQTIKGEKPIKANGKLMVIDGGFSPAYQPETGIAGYTLVFHSRGFQLVQHEPFTSITKAVEEGLDIKSTTQIVEMSQKRMKVKDTDLGLELQRQVDELKLLLEAYLNGIIKERDSSTSLIKLKR